MSLVATLKALVAAGATADMLIAVVETHEAGREAKAAERRIKDAARQKAKRVRDDHAESRGHDVTTRDTARPSPHVGAGAQVVTPFSSSLRSEEVGGGGVDATASADSPPPDDWPLGSASRHAELLVEAIASPWLDPIKSPDLVTTRGRIACWKRDGASWEHDVLPVVMGLCTGRRSRISSWKFFDQAICRSIADNRQALSIPEATDVRPNRNPGNGREARRGVWAEVLAEERGEGLGDIAGAR